MLDAADQPSHDDFEDQLAAVAEAVTEESGDGALSNDDLAFRDADADLEDETGEKPEPVIADLAPPTNIRTIEQGYTIADALRLLQQRVDGVYVEVPFGYGSNSSYFAITKAEATRRLSGLAAKPPETPFFSEITKVFERTNLYLGSSWDRTAHDRRDAAARAPQ